MKRRSYLNWKYLTLAVGLLAVAGIGARFIPHSYGDRPSYEYLKVERGPLRVTLRESAMVQPEHRLTVTPPIPGRIDAINVANGVAVKKGEHGCLLFGRQGEFFSTGAYPLETIHDPTGAGDCFAGGFIGHLARTDDTSFANLKEAVIQGTLVASYCCEDFSLRRIQKLTQGEIAERRKAFGTYIA